MNSSNDLTGEAGTRYFQQVGDYVLLLGAAALVLRAVVVSFALLVSLGLKAVKSDWYDNR